LSILEEEDNNHTLPQQGFAPLHFHTAVRAELHESKSFLGKNLAQASLMIGTTRTAKVILLFFFFFWLHIKDTPILVGIFLEDTSFSGYSYTKYIYKHIN
jgi:hypothetical protein